MLQRHFFYAFEGPVWKICLDQETEHLAVEVRQKDVLQTSFSVVNIRNGELVLNAFKPAERWWTGIENAISGRLLLHNYSPDRETGRHLGITAISEETGETIWKTPELTFLGLSSEETLLAENALGQVKEITLQTGTEKAFFQDRTHAKNLVQAFEKKRSRHLQLPVPYLPADAHYGLLQEFILKRTGRQAEQTIEYAETDNAVILSFYSRNPTVLANYLVTFSASGTLLLDICLEKNVTGLGLDTFFIFARKLFFIQEKTSLACYLL